MDTQSALEAAIRRAEEATPGPWEACTWDPMERPHLAVRSEHLTHHARDDIPRSNADARYIASLSPDVAKALYQVALSALAVSSDDSIVPADPIQGHILNDLRASLEALERVMGQ